MCVCVCVCVHVKQFELLDSYQLMEDESKLWGAGFLLKMKSGFAEDEESKRVILCG